MALLCQKRLKMEVKMNFSRDYLNILAHLKAPLDVENRGVCHDYSRLREYARDLLDDPIDREAEEKLSQLVKKLKLEEDGE